jgi:hypothetical protein
MFNSQRPRLEDLPTSRQLAVATLVAAASAGVLLVTVVLPSEYAIDPTGIGRALKLTQMGEIKQQLADEAALEAPNAALVAREQPTAAAQVKAPPTLAVSGRSDTMQLTLAPGEGAEIKATMNKGEKLVFDWSVAGGHVNFDTHADAPGVSYYGYGKGKESTGEQGELVAAFDGKHGWFWRNRSPATVTVTLRTQGAYTEIKRAV